MPVFKRIWRTKGGTQSAWYFKFTIEGETIYELARDPQTREKVKTKRAAENCEALAREAFIAGRRGTTQAPCFEKFVSDYYLPWAESNHTPSHFQSDRWRTKVLLLHFGKLRVDEISTFAVERFKRQYREEITTRGGQRKPASVNRVLQLLSKILSLAVSMKLMREMNRPEIKLLREDNHRLRYLTIEEEERWLQILAEGWPYLYEIVIVALGTGLRRSELFRLEKAHIDFTQEVIHVLQTKSGRPRQVPIGEETRSVLERLCEESPSRYVFTSYRTGGKFDDVKKGIAKTCQLAGIEGVTLHTLRHTYGTRLAAAGVDVAVIKELMGHSSISTTMRYVHAIAENKHQAVQKLSDFKNRCKIVAIEEGRAAAGGAK